MKRLLSILQWLYYMAFIGLFLYKVLCCVFGEYDFGRLQIVLRGVWVSLY